MDNINIDCEVLTFLVENYGDIVKIVLSTRGSAVNLILNTMDGKTIYTNHFAEKNTEKKLIDFFKKILENQSADIFSCENYSKSESSYNDLFFKISCIPMYPSGSDVIIQFIPNEDGMFLKSELIRIIKKDRETLSTIIKLDEIENKSIRRM